MQNSSVISTGGRDFLVIKFGMHQTGRQMPFSFSDIVLHQILIEVQEITIVTVCGDIVGPNGLLFEDELGSLNLHQYQRFLVVFFFQFDSSV